MASLLPANCTYLESIDVLCALMKHHIAMHIMVSRYVTVVNSYLVAIGFNQSTYTVDEDDGPAQPVLVLSNPSSTDITVQVRSNDITATGE